MMETMCNFAVAGAENEGLFEILRWGWLIVAIGMFLAMCQMGLGLVGLDLRELMFQAVERKKTGKFPFPAEKESRERVQVTMDNPSLDVREKCLLLDREIGRVMNSVFVSREWKNELSAKIDVLMKQNGLTLADFL